jgi:hypothetical protein
MSIWNTLCRIRDDAHFFMEGYTILLLHSGYYDIPEGEDVLPGSLLVIDEEVPMAVTHDDTSYASSLQSCFFDELASTPCLGMRALSEESLSTDDR